MNNQSYFGYTAPESLLFDQHTRNLVHQLWCRWFNSQYQTTRRFLNLAFKYTPARLEAACERAFYYDRVSIREVVNILEKKQDLLPNSPETDIEGQLLLSF